MRTLLFLSTALFVMGLAFWAYRENYETQAAIRRTEALQQEIGELRRALAMQRAEWAYLKRPDNLRELADINFDPLGLFPLRPEQFGLIDQVPYPQDETLISFSDTVEVSASLEDRP